MNPPNTKNKAINSLQKKFPQQSIAKVPIKSGWIQNKMKINTSLLICPICLSFVFQPVQCCNCQHLFCTEDFVNCKKIRNKCPICNHQPWNIKTKIHIMYQMLIQSTKFKCKICNNNDKYQVKSFKNHLSKKHGKIIQDYKLKLYKYWIKDNGKKKMFNFTQNLQINLNVYQLKSNIIILDEQHRQLQLNLAQDKCSFTKKNGEAVLTKLQREQIKENNYISFDKVYYVWSFQNNSTEQQNDQCYLQSHQKIIQKGYANFIKNADQSVVSIGFNSQPNKYTISFNPFSQVNNKTKQVLPIKRKGVVFSSKIN